MRPLSRARLARAGGTPAGVLAAAALVTLSTLLAPLAPAQAAVAPSYVALGDSYSSGTGTRSYLNDGTSCQRSTYAYPSLIAAARGYALNFRACSGAKIPDVTNTQLSALSTATKYVTISVGGNDAGFADVLTECAQPGWASNCDGAINTAQAYITNTLPSALSTLYAAIRSRATTAKVVVVGYPRVFMGEDCNAFTWFSPAEETRLNATADLLNSKLSSAAAAKGFAFANPTSRFTGHAVCDDPEWLNGLSNPVSESYHPNRLGHSSGYTPLVSALLTGATLTASAATLRTAAASGPALAAQQREYAAADRSIRPQVFRAPDLTSHRMRVAAQRAGIDLDRWIARH
ncbi:SGNH/GDSL hydrolase family protein [Nocardioides sp. KIGAM211]|uniref:SGNH/GDSL hydrolase family protein n=1 Tax=Nocardioides luti TaxID=2761101 RepID=A0A7X0RGR9_9ACTN|nr:SGNH/GDSL hydrolase family protein [Nocardioides luti]MBB6628038.1 SGNH/GDSL hydrolase family protein [Nocardioides luti]